MYAPLECEITKLQAIISQIEIVSIKSIKDIVYLTNQELSTDGTKNETEKVYELLCELDQRLGTDFADEIQFSTNRGKLRIVMARLRYALITQSFDELESLMQKVSDEILSLDLKNHASAQDHTRVQAEVNFVFSRCDENIVQYKISNDHVKARICHTHHAKARISEIHTQLREWLVDWKEFTHKDREAIPQELNKIVHYMNKVISFNETNREIEIAYQQIYLLWQRLIWQRLKSNNPFNGLDDPTRYILFKSRSINPEFGAYLDGLRQWMACEQYDAMDCLVVDAKCAFQALPPDQQKILSAEAGIVFEMAESCFSEGTHKFGQ